MMEKHQGHKLQNERKVIQLQFVCSAHNTDRAQTRPADVLFPTMKPLKRK